MSIIKIAVASQNRREITKHTGRCRKFWIYEIEAGTVMNKSMLELSKEQSFHNSSPHEPSPLDSIDVLISGGMGSGLLRRLQTKGINALITREEDPDQVVSDFLNGKLKSELPNHGEYTDIQT